MASPSVYPSHAALRMAASQWTPQELQTWQLERLQSLLDFVQRENPFYRERLGPTPIRLNALSDWESLPFLSKKEIEHPDDPMGLAKHHTFPIQQYARFHRTSGTMGKPMTILDTQQDWQWWVDTWQYVLDAAAVSPNDRVLLAFSFGPFIGFWSAFDACVQRNAMAIPTGGLSTIARVHLMFETRPTIVCCTPSYALQLAEVAKGIGLELSGIGVRQLIVAGEPGGSIPEVRHRLEQLWGAQVVDHAGATEIGPWGVGQGDGIHILETDFYPEFQLAPAYLQQEGDEPLFELILTNLGRLGSPLLRYKTGDLVRPYRTHTHPFIRLQGGVLGRVDDMIVIRGVNVFPSSIEAIVRSVPGIGEYLVNLDKRGEMDEICIEAEGEMGTCRQLSEQIHIRLGLRADVRSVPKDSLARQMGKSRRILDRRPSRPKSNAT